MAVGEKPKRKKTPAAELPEQLKPKRNKTTAAELPEQLKPKRNKTTAAELPEELIRREILTRLPIKSVVRFKCVSKSWLSLFSNPRFIKHHLTLNISRNPNDYDCLVAKKDNKVVILSRYKETLALPCSDYFRLIGCARGLVCLFNEHNLLLWNPAIHQYKEFTLPPHRARDYYFKTGFGYDRVGRNYMVVVLSWKLRSASVCYSNSDNWIDVSVPDNVFGDNRGRCMGNPITIVKDWPYWTFQIFEDEMSLNPDRLVSTGVYFKAVKFDARSNEFKSLPELYFDIKARGQDYAFSSEFVDVNDCLSLIVYDRNSECMLDIYSLVGEEGCCVWSKMYSIGPLDFGSENWFVSQGFYGGEIVLCAQGMFSCYDHKTDTIKCLSKTSTIDPYIRCFRYRPSLVFLEGMKSVYLKTQTRARGTSGLCFRVPRRLIKSLRTKSFA